MESKINRKNINMFPTFPIMPLDYLLIVVTVEFSPRFMST